jgi:hypothetical protein
MEDLNFGLFMAIVAVVIGVLILIVPRILNYAVAIYLIVTGVLGILDNI